MKYYRLSSLILRQHNIFIISSITNKHYQHSNQSYLISLATLCYFVSRLIIIINKAINTHVLLV